MEVVARIRGTAGGHLHGLSASESVATRWVQGERVQTPKQLTKLDRAIAVIRKLAGTEPTPNGRPKKWTQA